MKRLASMALLLLLTGCASPPSQQAETPPPKQTFSSIRMLTESAGWGVGDGKVLRTTDGGSTWLDVTPPGVALPKGRSPDQTPAYFLDEQTGWVAVPEEQRLTIFRTADGGRTWKSSTLDGLGSLSAQLSFLDEEQGFALLHQGVAMGSEQVEVLRSLDGGRTWSSIATTVTSHNEEGSLPFGGLKKGIAFRDASQGWITAEDRGPGNGRLYETRDGGQTWSTHDFAAPAKYQEHALTIYPPLFFDDQTGMLPVTVVPGYETIFYTTEDGGSTWTATTPVKASPQTTTFLAYDWVDPEHGWSTDGERIYRTDDGGQTWESLTPTGGLKGFKQLDFVSRTAGWAVVDGGLAKSVDGGETWVLIDASSGAE